MRTITLACWLAAVLLATAVHADTLLVLPDGSGDYPTIQEAIAAAVPGDIIELGDGVFTGVGNHNINFHGASLTVRSMSGDPSACIIDVEGNGRGFNFVTNETDAAVLEGVTITGGVIGDPLAFGGGIFCSNASPTVRNCVVSDCHALLGGGMACTNGANPLIEGCLFTLNSADAMLAGGSGGGLYVDDSDPTVDDCVFTENTASGNMAGNGGGVRLSNSSAVLRRCTIAGNTADSSGGGGLAAWGSGGPVLEECVITGNWVTPPIGIGAGVYIGTPSAVMVRCTVASNRAEEDGGGLYVAAGSTVVATNTIFRGNCATRGPDMYVDGTLNLQCCLADPAGFDGSGVIDFGDGMVFAAPLFCDSIDCSAAPTPLGDYSIDETSPAAGEHAPAGCGLIGALDVGCSLVTVEPSTWGNLKDRFRVRSKPLH